MQLRRLLLVRHATAADGPVDVDRPLTADGEERAAAIGAWLRGTRVAPDRVLVSPARRAVRTWELAGASLSGPSPVVDARLYDNTVEDLLEVIGETPDGAAMVAVVGHNPSIGVLASELDDGRGDPGARSRLQAGFPAGGVAVFDLAAAYHDLGPGAATLRAFSVPGD